MKPVKREHEDSEDDEEDEPLAARLNSRDARKPVLGDF